MSGAVTGPQGGMSSVKRQWQTAIAGVKEKFRPTSFQGLLWGVAQSLKGTALIYPQFRARLKERNLIAQIIARDEGIGRWFELRNGKVQSRSGMHKRPDITLGFKNAALGVELLTPPINWLNQVNAQKDFKLTLEGSRT